MNSLVNYQKLCWPVIRSLAAVLHMLKNCLNHTLVCFTLNLIVANARLKNF